MSKQISYPVGEEQKACAICEEPLFGIPIPLTSTYPNLVCKECERQAVTENGEEPKQGAAYREKLKGESDNPESIQVPTDSGENPVYIDGQKCWRRYKFGGFITQVDEFNCDSLIEFKEKHYP